MSEPISVTMQQDPNNDPSPTAGGHSATKQEALSQIRKAKGAHIRWRAFAQALVSGVAVDEEKIPVEHTSCAFGKWYHGRGQVDLGHLDSYAGIATPHEMLHAIYRRIFDTLHGDENISLLTKIFSGKAAREREKYHVAREYMEELIGVSTTMLMALDMLEREVRDAEDL